jgi:hypothetical protein
MIGLSIGLNDRRLLLIIYHFRNGLLHHLHNSYVGRRRCRQNVALRLGVTLILIDDMLIGNARVLVSFTSHGVGSGSGTTSSKRLEGESEKMMGLDVLRGAQLYMCNKRYYDDSFLQKICLSVSTT